ncbi:MAG: porin [Acetobacteraceae bacterium]|nr:porin [Acetobacteraceae bacterium]
MRKLLLISVAALGVSAGVADSVFAQDVEDNTGQAVSPSPGTITVRLNGRVRIFAGGVWDSDANGAVFTNVGVPAGSAVSAGTGFLQPLPYRGPGNVAGYGVAGNGFAVVAPPAGYSLQFNKQGAGTITSYMRLYPGFDGVAANGLKYGASIEIRQDNNSGAGGGVYGPIFQQGRQRGEMYIRREWGYIGTDQLGTLRVGSTDGPTSLFMVGNFENFNDGGWNGDVPAQIAPNLQVIWPWSDVGNMYTTNKIVYLSPQFYGVDFGLSYEPNTGNDGQLAGSPGCNGSDNINAFIPATQGIAGAGCDRLASTTTGDYTRRRNTFDLAARYRGVFGAVGLAAYGGWIGSSSVTDSTPQFTPGFNLRNQFDGLDVGVGGVAVTYAGLTVGGMGLGGRVNGSWNLTPKGAPSSTAWLAGTSYTYGPLIVGTSAFEYWTPGVSGPAGLVTVPAALGPYAQPGFSSLAGQRRERGVAAGGTYSVAPGLALFASYLFGDRQENGYNFITSQVSTPTQPLAGANNNYVHAQLFMLGTSFTW